MGIDANLWTSAYKLQQQVRYKSGLLALDALIPDMMPGSLILLQGDIPRKLLRQLVTKISIGLLTVNDPSELAFIDGENLFPYYDIASEARRNGYDPLTILDRIQLSRAFNFHQLTEIITKRLPNLLEVKNQLKIVLVPQISSLYLSTEALEYLEYANLSPAEGALSELTQAVGTLKSLALQHNLVVIMTAASATGSKTKGLGGTYLTHSASSVIRMTSLAGSSAKEYDIQFSLQKDPARPVVQLTHSHRQKTPVNSQTLLNRYW
jgi:RecA/RadA recombinase